MLSLKIKTGGNLMRHAIACGGQYGSESFLFTWQKMRVVESSCKFGAKRPKSLPEAGI